MKLTRLLSVPACLALLLLAGCASVRDSVIDQAAGAPASSLIEDVRKTSGDHDAQRQDERVDELSGEYEEFLRSRDAGDGKKETPEQSVIIERNSDQDN
jgi:hypothetical protein